MRPTYNEIDLGALRHNLEQIKNIVPKGTNILPIVKANAYGHGSSVIANELQKCGINYFGVATVGEALELRKNNINTNILILGSFYESDLDDILWHKLTPVCYRRDHLEKLNNTAKAAQTKINIHVKFDTGMGRLGFEWTEADEIIKKIKESIHLSVEGLMSHLACSDENTEYNTLQIERFQKIKDLFLKNNFKPKFFHVSNSSAIIKGLSPLCNFVRPGLALYGAYNDVSFKKLLELKQLMNLRSEITQIKELQAGRSVSYGRTFITSKTTKVAIIPIGYADGYNRKLSNKGRVIVKNEFAKVIGSVCMDMLAIDITNINDVKVGDKVTLTGYDGDKFISLNELSADIGTLPYEVMCNISERVIKRYINGMTR